MSLAGCGLIVAYRKLGFLALTTMAFVANILHPGDLGHVIRRQAMLYAEEYGWDWTYEGLACEILGRFVAEFDRRREDARIAVRGGEIVGSVFLVKHSDITAKLLDVHPNGFVQRLCDGLSRLRYRDGHERALEVEPDVVYEIEVVMWDTCHRFLAGHRVRLEVASSAHPKFAVNLGIAGDQSTATEGVIARNRLFHDAERPSRLVLPAMAPESAAEAAE